MAFTLHEKDGLLYHTSDVLGVGVSHAFTTRCGGVSPAPYDSLNLRFSCDDARENVEENYRRLCSVLDISYERGVTAHQRHHDHILLVTENDAGKGLARTRDYEDIDALITAAARIPLYVFSADCGITLLHDPVHHAVGAVHSGWRGVALGILPKTIRRRAQDFGTKPEELRIAIGAGIRQCCFETDDDVSDALYAAYGEAFLPYRERRGDKWHIDLAGLNIRVLRSLGIPEAQIDLLTDCTFCNKKLYWSHRRDGDTRGVQCAVISLL